MTTMLQARDALALVDDAIERAEVGESIAEAADVMAGSLRSFTYGAWSHVLPTPLVRTWHIDAICDHVEAAYRREIPRLLITIQPGASKSTMVSVIAPAWRWTHEPWERIVSASHIDDLATRDTRGSRTLIAKPWYQMHWADRFDLAHDENMKTRYSNTTGGYRVATHVGGGTGERGGVLILDDPHNAQKALQLTENDLQSAREWMGNTWASRLDASNEDPGVKIVIGQRVHEKDVMAFLLDGDEDAGRWVHLCLPARYSPSHPFVYPESRTVSRVVSSAHLDDDGAVAEPEVRVDVVLQGDPRTAEGELLAPAFMNEDRLAEVQHDMGERTKQSQYQQLPTPREGGILKRADWRYYPRAFIDDTTAATFPAPFRMIVNSWDTSFKAKVTSDKVAGGLWGFSLRADPETGAWIPGADHYLLRTTNQRMSLSLTKTAMKEFRAWALARWPHVPVYTLIEKASNGVEIIEQLEREIDGVIAYTASVDKKLRAEAAAPALESHNVFLPGEALADGTGPSPDRTDAEIMEAVEQAAKFTGQGNEEDDWVDQFTQMVNWGRTKDLKPSTVTAPPDDARIGRVGGTPLRGGPTGISMSGVDPPAAPRRERGDRRRRSR